jgi:hypothetical protein
MEDVLRFVGLDDEIEGFQFDRVDMTGISELKLRIISRSWRPDISGILISAITAS